MHIHSELAQQIVDSAQTIVGWNVNFITKQGAIIASTDAKRIGMYHAAGHKAAKTKDMQIVSYTGEYEGAVQGINYPIIMHHDVAGVIGITGEPDIVGQYGFLLTKICEVFLREYELEAQSFSEQQRISHVVTALIYHDVDSIAQLIQDRDIGADDAFIVVTLALTNPGSGQERLEKQLIQTMQGWHVSLYTSIYPNTLVFLLTERVYDQWKRQLRTWQPLYGETVTIGVGTWERAYTLHHSYRFSQMALRYGRSSGAFCVFAENMNVELLLESIDAPVRRQYKERLCAHLSAADLALLHAYYAHDLSIQETADALHIHKNTLQYRLKRIHEKSGLDPRKFRDAVPLYIAVQMND